MDKAARRLLSKVKAAAVGRGDEVLAKAAWCLEVVADVQDHYVAAFQFFKQKRFYDGWSELERGEIALDSLDAHYVDSKGTFGLEFIRSQSERFQSVFPYALFISPEYVYKRLECNICGAELSLRNPCSHKVGEIYGGEICHRVVRDMEVVAVATVRHPVQKYSVLGVAGTELDDFYDYSVVDYVVRGLRSPWDGWDFIETKIRHPHERFSHVPPGDPCPCESSGTYEDCCLKEEGVLRPHFQILFRKQPPPGLPPLEYTRRNDQ